MARIKYKEAAGINVRKGRPAKKKKPTRTDLIRLYIKESKSIREVSDILGCSKDMIYRSLKEYGIERRPKTRRSQLRVHSLKYLKDKIAKKGYKKAAIELGVGVTTLRDYMRVNE